MVVGTALSATHLAWGLLGSSPQGWHWTAGQPDHPWGRAVGVGLTHYQRDPHRDGVVRGADDLRGAHGESAGPLAVVELRPEQPRPVPPGALRRGVASSRSELRPIC